MTKSNPGWQREPRRHSLAAMKGQRSRSYRQQMTRTPAAKMEPCLTCGAPTLPGRTMCQRCENDFAKGAGERKGYNRYGGT
jgi:hypothetical protein